MVLFEKNKKVSAQKYQITEMHQITVYAKL